MKYFLLSLILIILLTGQASAIVGDLNLDGTVNLSDLLLIVHDFAKTSGFNPIVDLAPPSGQINIFDVMVVVKNWGKSDNDTRAPNITGVVAVPSATSAAITWTTDEVSDSQIEYGLTTSYGSSSTLNSAMVTAHSQTITGLVTGNTYHFRVKSKDAAGNLATSGDFTFIPSLAPLQLTTVSLGSCIQGTPYTKTFTASGGTPPYVFTKTPASIPAWATFTAPTLFGNPVVGTNIFKIRVTDALGTFVERNFTLNCVTPGSGPHAFFDTLCERDDVLKADTTKGGKTYKNVPRCWSFRPDPTQTVNSEINGTGIYHPRWAYQLNSFGPPFPVAQRGYVRTEKLDANKRSFVGYQNSASTCTLDGKTPGNTCDTRSDAQDAAKMIFPPYQNFSSTALNNSVGITDTTINITEPGGFGLNSAWKMCNEIIVIRAANKVNVTTINNVSRGQFGTTAAPCAAGTELYVATSDAISHIDLEVNTKSGADSEHNYLFIYDYYLTPTFLQLGNWHFKTLYMYSGSGNAWLLPIWDMDAPAETNPYRPPVFKPDIHVGSVSWRQDANECPPGKCDYDDLPVSNTSWAGSNVTQTGSYPLPVNPGTGFAMKAGKWTRVFILIEQKIDDYDLVSIWIGDEEREPVKMWSQLPFTLGDGIKSKKDDGTPNNIDEMHLGWDTSFNGLARTPNCNLSTYKVGDFEHEDCVMAMYLRNFVILEDPPDVNELVKVKPVS